MFTVVFIVKYTFPMFDASTDGFIGTHTTIVEAFATYLEAEQYVAENYNPHEVNSFEDGHYYIELDVTWDTVINGREVTAGFSRPIHELTVNSHYTGPDPYAGIF